MTDSRQWRSLYVADLVETTAFARAAAHLWTEDELRTLQTVVAQHPERGVIIPGSGGIRKLRWSLSGKGTRGGARVIYFWLTAAGRVLLLAAYSKATTKDLSRAEIKALTQITREFQEAYGETVDFQ